MQNQAIADNNYNQQVDKCYFISVLLPLNLPEALLYKSSIKLEKGDFVEVTIGKRVEKGIVWQLHDKVNVSYQIKPIIKKIDFPSLKKPLIDLLAWVCAYTVSSAGNILKLATPVAGAIRSKEIEVFSINQEISDYKITASRQKILDLLTQKSPLTQKEIVKEADVSASVIKNMVEKKALIKNFKILEDEPVKQFAQAKNVSLSLGQQQAADKIISNNKQNKFMVTVLNGVTGSGKTEVYFEVIENLMQDSQAQVLILLPEVILTNQLFKRFSDRFGFEPTKWHSSITKKQRENNYRLIASGKTRLVIGARSALFLPYKNLKMIIVDEEHDGSYKQEEGVVYQARDMAVARGKFENISVLLASATPSIETINNVKNGKYSQIILPSRFGKAVLPDIKIIDMKKYRPKAGSWVSAPLAQALIQKYKSGKQSLLYLNRRGYAPLTLCRNCGFRYQCTSCDSWLVKHKYKNILTCHHCNYNIATPQNCASCNEKDSLVACGPGVERIFEEVKKIIPEANIALMTSDNVTSQKQAASLIEQIINGEIDIIIGTQIIAKGHHFPDLTMVGIIDADLGLAGGDMRAAERSYQLLEQVAGRAGREEAKGEVFIQSYIPENNVIKALASGNREEFIETEFMMRKNAKMPPFSKLASIIISGKDEKQAREFANKLAKIAIDFKNIEFFGPAPAPVFVLRKKYRYRILIRSTKEYNIQQDLRQMLSKISNKNQVSVKIDIDPYSFF